MCLVQVYEHKITDTGTATGFPTQHSSQGTAANQMTRCKLTHTAGQSAEERWPPSQSLRPTRGPWVFTLNPQVSCLLHLSGLLCHSSLMLCSLEGEEDLQNHYIGYAMKYWRVAGDGTVEALKRTTHKNSDCCFLNTLSFWKNIFLWFNAVLKVSVDSSKLLGNTRASFRMKKNSLPTIPDRAIPAAQSDILFG